MEFMLMFIFSFLLFVIGWVVDDAMASSDPGSFTLPSLKDVSMIGICGVMFLFTVLILLLKRL